MTTPETNSYSYIIREGILERLKLSPTFSSVAKFARNRIKGPVQSSHLPYLGCYILEETLTTDGDPNAGAPKFTHHLKLGFSVIIQSLDDETAERNLDTAHWAIMNYLHRADWHTFPMPPGFRVVDIEGIEKGLRKHVFGNSSLNNETPIAELQMDLTFKYRSYFEPYIYDHFDRMGVTVAPTWPYDPGAYVPEFKTFYELNPDDPATKESNNGN